jgi:tetratricopeptide (TPR) repeat protein
MFCPHSGGHIAKLILVLIACTACASAPVATVSTPVASVQTSTLIGAAKWADSAARLIDRATIAGNLEGLRSARTLLDQALVAYPNDGLLLHYEGYELYREAGLLDGLGGKGTLDVPLVAASARAKLQQSLAAQPLPESHALLANVMGRMIAADQSSAPVLGPLIPEEMTAAISAGPTNPRVWLLRGIQSFYTPAQYGGGLPIAEVQLNKAIELFAMDNPTPPAPSWGRAEAYVWLGQVLERGNRIEDARVAYKKALSIEPNYPWVTGSLLPLLGRR